MAQQVPGSVGNNPVMARASGQLGREIVFRQCRDGVIIAKAPGKRRRTSRKQWRRQNQFRQASQYASLQMQDPQAKALYQTGITTKKLNAHTVALTDFLNAPRIHNIDTSNYTGAIGDTISIHATDDFNVTSVKVSIIGSDQLTLEENKAIRDPDSTDLWHYHTTVQNHSLQGTTIRVTAFDKPGNTATQEKLLPN